MKLSRKQDFIHTSVLKSHISTTTITTTTTTKYYYYYAYIENHSYDDIVPRNNKNETESELSLRSLSHLQAGYIEYCSKKETTLRVGHFTTISDHFPANYINIFHKTGVQKNIIRCLTCLNLNWI